ncbi:hypothetical protein M2145_001113 [Lachnospiraceae bacterium PF1-21]
MIMLEIDSKKKQTNLETYYQRLKQEGGKKHV